MTKYLFRLTLVAGLMIASSCTLTSGTTQGLRVAEHGRYLLEDDKPFFWLADTIWRGNALPEDVLDAYLKDRVAKGFNVLQGPIVTQYAGFEYLVGNPIAELKDANNNETFDSVEQLRFNEGWLQGVDRFVEKAAEYDLYVVLAAVWGPVLDVIVSTDQPERAYELGLQLGTRYAHHDHVLWIVIGEYQKIAWDKKHYDRERPNEAELNLIRHLAKGLEAGHGGRQLMTVHANPGTSSSRDFHDAPWLDFNMIQWYDLAPGRDAVVWRDFAQMPAKPTVVAEPPYEDSVWREQEHTGHVVRYSAYHAVFAGAMGHTYGHGDIWIYRNAAGQLSDVGGATRWEDDLQAEGAGDMQHLKALFQSRPVGRRPMNGLLVSETGHFANLDKAAATIGHNGGYAFVYFPDAKSARTIDLRPLQAQRVAAWWFDPRDGGVKGVDGVTANQPFASFVNQEQVAIQPPQADPTLDWVLVLDDSAKLYPPPGTRNIWNKEHAR